MLCIYCNEIINESTPTCNVGGKLMHCSCQAEYSAELEFAFPDDPDFADYQDDSDCPDYACYDDGHYDNDPSPYDGTYSEI